MRSSKAAEARRFWPAYSIYYIHTIYYLCTLSNWNKLYLRAMHTKICFEHDGVLDDMLLLLFPIWFQIYIAIVHFRIPYIIIWIYRQLSNIRRTLVGNKIVDHSDVVGASPVGAAPTTSSFSTSHMASLDWAKTPARWDEKHLSLAIWCVLY